jgi:hypothetical protein
LTKRPALAAKLASSLKPNAGFALNEEDIARLSAVFEKIARGLWAFEVGETAQSGEGVVRYMPIAELTTAQLEAFKTLEQAELLPEVGSRRMIRSLTGDEGSASGSWIELQPARFSYGIEISPDGGHVEMILGDYLAVEVDLRSS